MKLDMPKKNNMPEKKVEQIDEIWHGEEINKVRKAQLDGTVSNINICKSCPFKETYKWKKIN